MVDTRALAAQFEGSEYNEGYQAVAYRQALEDNNNRPEAGEKQQWEPIICGSYLTSQAGPVRSGRRLTFRLIGCKTGKTLRIILIIAGIPGTAGPNGRPP